MTDQQLRFFAEKANGDRGWATWASIWLDFDNLGTGDDLTYVQVWSPDRALAALAVIEAGRRLFCEGDGDPATQEQMETALAAWDALGGDA